MSHITAMPSACPLLAAADVLDSAHVFDMATSQNELCDRTAEALKPLGYAGFTLAFIRRVKTVFLHARVFSSWPISTQSYFEQHMLFNNDPVIQRSRVAHGPFAWDLSIYEDDNAAHQPALALRRRLGVKGGVCLPVFEAFGGRSVLYLSGRDFDTSPRALLTLQLLAEHLTNRANALVLPPGEIASSYDLCFQNGGELSPREQQTFGWIAFGKSSREVAAIMSISEHTVNDYIASAMAKLQASNRTEAVMRAMLTNQIDLS